MPSCPPGENGELCRATKRAEYQMMVRKGQMNQAAFNKAMSNTRRGRKNRRNNLVSRRNRKNRKVTRRNRKANRRN